MLSTALRRSVHAANKTGRAPACTRQVLRLRHQNTSRLTARPASSATATAAAERVTSNPVPREITSSSYNASSGEVAVNWGASPASSVSSYPAVYLRDNCPCAECRHTASGIRTREMMMWEQDVVDTMTKIKTAGMVAGGGVQVEWGDGHTSTYPSKWLREHRLSADPDKRAETRFVLPDRRLWSAAEFPRDTNFKLDTILSDDGALLEFLDSMYRYGVALVRDCGTEHGSVEKLASRVGFLRDTVFGRTWQIKVVANPSSMAYTTFEAPMHIDCPYFETPPGLLMLHCLQQAPSGGYTYCTDGFLLAETLRKQEPDTFRLLCDVPVTWSTRGHDHTSDIDYDFEYDAPVITLDQRGNVRALRLNQIRSSFLQLDADRVALFYDAMRTLARLSVSADYRAAVRLEPGEMILIDNHRMLHGRSELNMDGGAARCLSGGYMDWDNVISRIRQINAAKTSN